MKTPRPVAKGSGSKENDLQGTILHRDVQRLIILIPAEVKSAGTSSPEKCDLSGSHDAKIEWEVLQRSTGKSAREWVHVMALLRMRASASEQVDAISLNEQRVPETREETCACSFVCNAAAEGRALGQAQS